MSNSRDTELSPRTRRILSKGQISSMKENLLQNDNSIPGEPETDEDNSVVFRSYTSNAPKIMLETISARTATIILAVTYLTFALAFLFDLRSTMNGFRSGNKFLSSASCKSQGIITGDLNADYGCTQIADDNTSLTQDVVWVGHVHGFDNIISVALQAKYRNVTSVSLNGTTLDDDEELQDITIQYDVTLYACYHDKSCGSVSSTGQESGTNHWKKVLTDTGREVTVGDVYNIGDDSATVQLLPNTFQNQESLPDNGKVKSYLVYVTYKGTQPYFVSSSEVEYKFANINRSSYFAARVMLQFCVFCTLLTIAVYVRGLLARYKSLAHALPEQRWLLWYMMALVLFQNPVYCVITWHSSPSPDAVYTAYFIDAFAQASFFTIWLIYADGLRRQFNYYTFYVPKLVMGLLLFATNLVVTTLQFPSVSNDLERSPVTAVSEWSYNTKISFIVFSLSFLCLLMVWTAWWFYSLWNTGNSLSKLPYMSTRYLQLWFRFFLLQATLVTLYYVFQYFVTIYYIFHYSDDASKTSVENITDNINTLFRQQSLLFGKVFFLTVYAMILAFFFFPAGMLDEHMAAVAALAATYVVNESEIPQVYRARQRAIRKTKTISRFTQANPNVFCVDLALELLEIAFQSYNDPKSYPTDSGYGVIEVEKYGYRLLNHAYDSEHDTVCFIFKHSEQPKVVIAFRGTCSKKHWSANLNYSRRPVDLASMTLDDLDALDGLEDVQQAFNNEGGASGRIFTRQNSHMSTMENESDSDSDSESWNDDDIDANRRSVRRSLFQVQKGVSQAANMAVDATTDMLALAASHTPGLHHTVNTHIHSGFWEAYLTVRVFIHTVLRQELVADPAHVYCTGHSLGGALATLASADIALHTIPRVNAFLKAEKAKRDHTRNEGIEEGGISRHQYSGPIKKVKICMYNFGSPRVGNIHFAMEMNKWVPNSFRVVVDGDIVSGVPRTGYKHAGTEIVVDAIGAGSIIVDPSFVEKRLRTSNKTSVSSHSLFVYRRGLQGVKAATEYTRSHMSKRYQQTGGVACDEENMLIAEQMKLAFESGEIAVKLTGNEAREMERVLNEQYSSDNKDIHNRHDMEVEETRDMARTVKMQQRSLLSRILDRTRMTMGFVFTLGDFHSSIDSKDSTAAQDVEKRPANIEPPQLGSHSDDAVY
mmetsp:Transcript_16006/g.24135  ORF Transcript_16006/g.24135 Transcript_16006/m.24135 type:complete len:1161 (-) Transcript_16006:137-3619(-)